MIFADCPLIPIGETLPETCEEIKGTKICPASELNVQDHLCSYKEIIGDKNYLAINAAINGLAIFILIFFVSFGIFTVRRMLKGVNYELLE